ncbi:hypothetical protein LCGC14_1001490 [marine sediment metagenome]|uniref:Uncharacterized protein n=1 Tax=marine sediment metagenome TaxID=412755 RepID=A0A0F9R914_9ZZZZ
MSRLSIPEELRKKFATAAGASSFYGVPVRELNREDLLCMIGWMAKQHERQQKQHWRDLDMLSR